MGRGLVPLSLGGVGGLALLVGKLPSRLLLEKNADPRVEDRTALGLRG